MVTASLLQNTPPNFMNTNAEVLKSYKIVPVTFRSTDISINVESERNEQKKITEQIQHVESLFKVQNENELNEKILKR